MSHLLSEDEEFDEELELVDDESEDELDDDKESVGPAFCESFRIGRRNLRRPQFCKND